MANYPDPEGTAAARCTAALLMGLASRGVECRVVCVDTGDPLPSVPAGVILEAAPSPPRTRAQIRMRRLLRPLGELARGPFAERVEVGARTADVVHFADLEAAAALGRVHGPALVQLDCLTRRDPRVWNPLRLQGRRSIELLRGEVGIRRRARWLLASSPEVAGRLTATAPRARVSYAPLALDPAHYEPAAALDSSLVGLIGTARWPPTQQAVVRLLTRVWPLVRARRPDARLLLAGDGMEPAHFGAIAAAPGVEWRGRVESAADFLRELGVLLYPLSRGSGAKVKVLEALALGIPIVTTPDGAEGVGAGGGVTVETDDDRLATSVIALCEDAQARREAGAAARRAFALHHSPGTAAAAVAELYERMVEAGEQSHPVPPDSR
jgi:glycosyltransferase involved in cell wall biosynthesis